MHELNGKMTKRDEAGWVIDTGDDPPRLSPRFRNIAVKRLGYTHTEAGRRTLGQIADELSDLCEMEREAQEGPPDFSWIGTEEEL